MPNVTISVPEDLKRDMDELTEVSWSQVCRNAISRYITERKRPTPNIELDLQNISLEAKYHESGYPVLSMSLRIHNKMEFDIIIDRILFNVGFWEGNRVYYVGSSYDLYKNTIPPTLTISKQTFQSLPKEKIEELRDTFDSTFRCGIRCIVFVEGFKQPYSRELHTRIPIDEWKKIIYEATGVMT